MSFNCDRKKSNLLCNFSVQSHLKKTTKTKNIRSSTHNIRQQKKKSQQTQKPEIVKMQSLDIQEYYCETDLKNFEHVQYLQLTEMMNAGFCKQVFCFKYISNIIWSACFTFQIISLPIPNSVIYTHTQSILSSNHYECLKTTSFSGH